MELSKFQEKYVQLKDIYGNTFTGYAVHHSASYCFHEYGEEEEAIQITGYLVYASQIASIEEVEPHGSAEIWTERMILRRYDPEDAEELYRCLGTDPEIYRYSGWNPYATPEMARETVNRFIEQYSDPHFYGWIMDYEDYRIGTIGAYDYRDDRIEVGFSVRRDWWGRGFATEALKSVLIYLTEQEGIACVTAWCAGENM